MNTKYGIAAAAALCLAMASAAGAQDLPLGYSYFSRAGTDIGEHNATVAACVSAVAHTSPPADVRSAFETANAVAAQQDMAAGDSFNACMFSRYWRLNLISDAEGLDLSALAPAELSARLAAWVGAARPHGTLTGGRADTVKPETRFATMPEHAAAGELSLNAIGVALPAAGADIARMTLGYSYFNRPGADATAHDSAVTDCAAQAVAIGGGEKQGSGFAGVSGSFVEGFAVAGLSYLITDAMAQAAQRGVVDAALENCMVVRGWRVVLLPDSEGAALARLAPAEVAARLAPWIGAAQPHGAVVRVWRNNVARRSTIRFEKLPDHTNGGQLSLKAAMSAGVKPPPPADNTAVGERMNASLLKASDLMSAPAAYGIILVRVAGAGWDKAPEGVVLEREGPASGTDHLPDQIVTKSDSFFQMTSNGMFAYAVPPGRWRIAAVDDDVNRLSFCMGGPEFELRAGDVVYAGGFDLGEGGGDFGPDLDLTPVKAWLAGRPRANAVSAAVYVNGSRGVCQGSGVYALEVAGAPYVAGYAWGGAASGDAAAAPERAGQ